MSKKWAEDYSSDEGEQETHEGELVSEDEKEPKESVEPEDSTPSTGFIAYITDINFSATRDDVGNHFDSMGCNISKLDLLLLPNGRSTGNAVIEFFDSNSLDICIQASGSELKGRRVRTSLNNDAFNKPDRRQDRSGDRDAGGRGGRGGYNNRDRPSREVRDNREPREYSGRREFNRQDRPQDGRQDNRQDGRRSQDARFERQTETRVQRAAIPTNTAAASSKSTEKVEEAPSVRPKLVLQPRSLPLETVGQQQSTTKSSIFGEGHANDNVAYEKKKATAVTSKSEPDVSAINLNAPAPPATSTSTSEGTVAPPAAPAGAEGGGSGPKEPRRNNTRDDNRGGRGGGRDSRNSRENKPRGSTAPSSETTIDKQVAEGEVATTGSESQQTKSHGREKGEGKQSARIFNNAVNAAGAGKKSQGGRGSGADRKPKEEQNTKPTETDEEKFKRAQLTIAKADSASTTKIVKKKAGAFDVLGSDDDDDDN